MFDLQVLAYQSDLTRVITFMMARELSGRIYPEIGVPDPHHPLSHHRVDPAKIAKVEKINMLPLDAVRLLPREAAGDAGRRRHAARSHAPDVRQRHEQRRPALACEPADRAGRRPPISWRGPSRALSEGTPITNLYLSMLDKVGVRIDSFGDSTGRLTQLSGV